MHNLLPSRNNTYERWVWIELIGFDNTKPDVGVQEYLDKLGFIPAAASFLITAPDIIHEHTPLDAEKVLPPDCCSYYGHGFNAERKRQAWTNQQLHQLVVGLRAQGIKVYLSTFTMWAGNAFRTEWMDSHHELWEMRRSGERIGGICALKRFADGSYYEDFFIPRLVETLQDYEFDGWHAADGWGPGRLPINDADFSDDMIEQFVRAQNIELPADLTLQADGENEKVSARADWIWSKNRRAWLDFYSDRWASFYQKKVAALHGIGKQIVINSSWTRDPFEALYRYGVDYRKLIDAGIDGIVTESAAGASDMEAEEGNRLYNYTATLLLIRAYVPDTKLLFLHGIKDTKEQWDLLRHAPTVLESEVFSLCNVYRRTEENTLQRGADGFVGCLSDGLRPSEWEWLARRWEIAFDETPKDLIGATLVWSDAAHDQELNDFTVSRSWTTHRLLHKLMQFSAAVHSAVRVEDIDNITGPLLVLNSHNFPQAELDRIANYQNGPVITIGRPVEGLAQPDATITESPTVLDLASRIYGWEGGTDVTVEAGELKRLEGDVTEITEPTTFLADLEVHDISEAFLRKSAEVISEIAGAPRIASGEGFIQVQAMEQETGRLRLLIKNSRVAYSSPRIDVGQEIDSIKVITDFPVVEVVPDGSTFAVKVPGRGATIVDVLLK
jgi:hypothetical protein